MKFKLLVKKYNQMISTERSKNFNPQYQCDNYEYSSPSKIPPS